jgi:hypothetical protein
VKANLGGVGFDGGETGVAAGAVEAGPVPGLVEAAAVFVAGFVDEEPELEEPWQPAAARITIHDESLM